MNVLETTTQRQESAVAENKTTKKNVTYFQN